jgi:UPF0716 protein FxsA
VVVLATAAVEIAVFVAVVHAVGAGWAVLALAVTCVAGLMLLRREGVRGWRRFRAAAEAGRPPGHQVSDGLVGLAGALLLAVPGFVTSVLGVLLLVPPLRTVVRRSVERATERRMTSALAGDLFGPRRVRVRRGDPVAEPADVTVPAAPGAAIEGEIVDAVPLTDR